MAQIIKYSTCKCGAITLFFDNGATNSIQRKNLKHFGLSLRNIKKLNQTWCCNHCANHYGLDICSCGSGADVGKCKCGSTSAMEQLGQEYDGFSQILKNFTK